MTKKIEELQKPEDILEYTKVFTFVVLDFYSPQCGPCRMQKTVLERFIEDTEEDVLILKIDGTKLTDCATYYSVRSLPHIVIYKNSKNVYDASGFMHPNQLREIIK